MYGMFITTVGHTACRAMPTGHTHMTHGITTIGGTALAGTLPGVGMTHGGALTTGAGAIRCTGDGIVRITAVGLSTTDLTTITSMRAGGIPSATGNIT